MLRYPDFALYWAGLVASTVATWMQILATTWLLYDLTRSPFLVGLSGVFQAGPVLGLSAIGGTVADRANRRALMLVAQVWTAALAFAVAGLVALEVIVPAEVYALIALGAIGDAFSGPASQSLLPALVPREQVGAAVMLTSVLWRGGSLIGPALAGLIIAGPGTAAAFAVAGLVYAVSAIAWLLMRPPARIARRRPSRFFRDLSRGLVYVGTHPLVGSLLVAEGVSNLVGDNPTMITLFAGEILRVGPAGLGFLTSALGLGAVLGSILLTFLGTLRAYGRLLLMSSIVYLAALAAFGLSRSFDLSMGALLVVGGGDTVWSAARSTVLQYATPAYVRGRVMGLLTLTTAGVGPLSGTESGIIAEILGVASLPLVGALATIALDLWLTRVAPELWRYRVRDLEPIERG